MPAPLAATLSHSSSGSSVLAAAASQAIAATQQVKLVLIRKMWNILINIILVL
jgi:hypothetical protein